MIRFTIFLLSITNFVHAFTAVTTNPPHHDDRTVQGTTNRLDDRTSSFVATAVTPLATRKTNQPSAKPKIMSLENEHDYRNFLEQDHDDRLCLIKFYAPYCKACQKFGMQYNRIGHEIGDLCVKNQDGSQTVVREGEIRLAEMDYGANKELCKSLGVTKLPSVHFYSKGRLVEGFPCGPRRIGKLLEKLARFRSMTPNELAFEADMNQGIALGESVLETLNIGIIPEKSKTSLPVC